MGSHTDQARMSFLCCCIPRIQQTPPRLKDRPEEEPVELQILRVLPTEIWMKIFRHLPLHVLWANVRPTSRAWNAMVLDIVWDHVAPTVVDIQWQTPEKRIRQRLYPSIPKSIEPPDFKPFSAIARWNLPDFEKALNTSERGRYRCTHVFLLLSHRNYWQNAAVFAIIKITEHKDIWEFEQLSSPMVDLDKAFFDLCWLPKWRITFREGEERRSSSSRGDMHLDHVTVPLAQLVKLIALTAGEEWPYIGKIDGFERKRRSRPNSGISTPRRRSEPTVVE
jgi:F-box-like